MCKAVQNTCITPANVIAFTEANEQSVQSVDKDFSNLTVSEALTDSGSNLFPHAHTADGKHDNAAHTARRCGQP